MGVKSFIGIVFLFITLLFLTSCGLIDTNGTNQTIIDYRDPSMYNTTIDNQTVEVVLENVTVGNETIYVPVYNKELKIASFNLQIFGDSKSTNTQIMTALRNVLDDYDIILLQEIRDVDGSALVSLQGLFPEYNFVFSERLGRTRSKEQYATMYKKNIITAGRSYVWEDQTDIFEREPHVVELIYGEKSFVLINVHVKPTDAQEEIRHLRTVYQSVESEFPSQVKLAILGDLNADSPYYSGGELKDYYWLLDDTFDTNVASGTKTYDRIIFKDKDDWDVTDYGVDYYEDEGFSKQLIDAISDHFIIYYGAKI